MLEQLAGQVADKARIVKAKVEDALEAATRHRVFSLPTSVFFKDGEEVDRLLGMASLAEMKRRVEEIVG